MKYEPLRPIVLRQTYPSWMVWHIWRAIRAEWRKVGGGRDFFAGHIDDIVMSTSNRQPVVLEDGTPFDFTTKPPSSKTIYNFLHSIDLADQRRQGEEPTASDPTLQYLHLYLCRSDPQKAACLDPVRASPEQDMIIPGLDRTLERLRPSAAISQPYFLYRPSARARDFARLVKEGIDDQTLSEMQWRRLGAIVVLPTDNLLIGKVFLFGADATSNLLDDAVELSGLQITDDDAVLSGSCIAFKPKDFTHSDKYGPSFSTDEGVLLAEFKAPSSHAARYASVRFMNSDLGFSWFEQKNILDGMMGLSFTGAFDEWTYCVPLPMSAAQAARFREVCALIG